MNFRTIAITGTVLLILIALYVFHIFSSTGFFRTIEPSSKINVLRKVQLPGAEDITISPDGAFAIISSDDRAARRDQEPYASGLYFLDMDQLDTDPWMISGDFDQPLNPHGISLYPVDSSRYRLLVINHVDGRHTIEDFQLFGDSLVHVATLAHPLMISPNDVVLVDAERFFFTNDHGYTSAAGVFLENYLGLAVSNVIFSDGTDYREVASGIAYANGINYNPGKQQLFVASPRDFKIKVYDVNEDYSLNFNRDIATNSGIDNLEIDHDGFLWTGAHPNLLRWSSYAAGKRDTSPSEILRIEVNPANGDPVEQFWLDNGELMSGSSVAARYKNILLIGNVMDKHFLITSLK